MSILARWPSGDPVPGVLARTETGPRRLPRELLARWTGALSDWGAPAAARDALDRLADPATPVVVTGQQPGVWGGPAYCLYKAATAVELAARLGREHGRPATAVFWIGADDTDWDEVGWGTLPRPDLDLYRTRWTASPLGSRRWVGGARLALPEGAEEVFAAWSPDPALLGGPRSGEPEELGASFARCLLAWFGERGLVPLDARWPEIRRGGRALWTAYHRRHREIAAAVRERGEAMRARGVEPPLDAEAADHGLFLLDGDRREETDPGDWDRAVGERLDAGREGDLGPSVLLRAPLQDHLFGTAAQVVGRGEAAYLEQLEPLYRALDIRPPARPPRLRATLVPVPAVGGDAAEAVVADPEAWLAARARRRVPEAATRDLAALREEAAARLDSVRRASEDFAKDMDQLTESARRKMDAQIHRLEEFLERRARTDLYRDEPALRNLPEFLRPRRQDQDRGLSGASLALIHGAQAPEAVLEAARIHLDALAGGEALHLALEGPHV